MKDLSLQAALVQSYLSDFSVKAVLGHDVLIYRWIGVKHLFLLGLIVLAYFFFDQLPRITPSGLKWYMGRSILIVYISCLYQLLDKYLDTFIVTDSGLILFQRRHPFAQDISVINRVSIESIQHLHHGFRSGLLNMGDIVIQVEDQKYMFRRIHAPMETVQKILNRKEKMTKLSYQENMPPLPKKEILTTNPETYNVLVEALGEVVQEYIKKKGT